MSKWKRDILGRIEKGKPKIEAYHVYPVSDLKEHDLNPQCHCQPSIKENGAVIVHNSYDGREFFEEEGH